jgi:hypothetical protein
MNTTKSIHELLKSSTYGFLSKRLVWQQSPGETPDTKAEVPEDADVAELIGKLIREKGNLTEGYHKLVDDLVGKLNDPRTKISADSLRVLAELKNEEYIQDIVASNPATPTDVLEIMAGRNVKEINRRLASNPSTPVDVLRGFLDDGEDKEVLTHRVAANSGTPESILLAIFKTGRFKESLAGNPSIPVGLLDRLATSGIGERKEVAGNKSAPEELLTSLATSTMKSLIDLEDTLNKMGKKWGEEGEEGKALLDRVKRNSRLCVRTLENISANPSTSKTTLKDIKEFVDANANRFSQEYHVDILVASRSRLTSGEELRKIWLNNPDQQLIINLARNPSTPPDILAEIVNVGTSGPGKASALSNPSMPSKREELKMLKKSLE